MLFCCLILQNFLARSKSIVIYLPSMTNKSELETDNPQRVHGVKMQPDKPALKSEHPRFGSDSHGHCVRKFPQR